MAKTLTEDQKTRAILMAVEGRSLTEIHNSLGLSAYDFWVFRQTDLIFNRKFFDARQEGLEVTADTLLTIIEDVPDVNKARLKSDNIKWLLSKRKASTYGDRLDLNLNQQISIGSALDEALLRARPVADPATIGSRELLIDTVRYETKDTDTESVSGQNAPSGDQTIDELLS